MLIDIAAGDGEGGWFPHHRIDVDLDEHVGSTHDPDDEPIGFSRLLRACEPGEEAEGFRRHCLRLRRRQERRRYTKDERIREPAKCSSSSRVAQPPESEREGDKAEIMDGEFGCESLGLAPVSMAARLQTQHFFERHVLMLRSG